MEPSWARSASSSGVSSTRVRTAPPASGLARGRAALTLSTPVAVIVLLLALDLLGLGLVTGLVLLNVVEGLHDLVARVAELAGDPGAVAGHADPVHQLHRVLVLGIVG